MAQRTEIVFVDSSLQDIETLLAGIPQRAEVVRINQTEDGLAQIAASLAGRSGIDAIHILSHGSQGNLQLGATSLSSSNLDSYSSQLAAIGSSLTETGDILLYGCNVAQGQSGVDFIGKLAQSTGADIAASNNLTGSTDKAGDWVLEATTGSIESTALIAATYTELLGTTVSFSGINAAMGVTDGQWGSADLPGVTLEFGFRTTAGDYPIDAVYTAGALPALSPDTTAFISRFFRIASNDNAKDFTISSFKVYNDTGSAQTLTITGSSDGIVYFSGFQTGTTIGSYSSSVPTGWSTVSLTGFTDISSLVIDYPDDIKMYFNDFVFGAPNTAPTLGGTFTTAGTVNDNATTTPFSSVTYTDADGTSYTVNIAYTAANGTLAGTGLTGVAGNYTVTGSSAADAQSKLQALVFTPTANQVTPGSTVQTTFTLTPNDGTVSGTANNTTQVTATSVNDTPTDLALSNTSVTVYDTANATVGTLSTTDADTGDSFTYTLVTGAGDTDNALFNISGSSLRANDPSLLTPGTYSVRVQTKDASNTTYEKEFSVTVSSALTVTTNLDSGADATTGGGYAAEMADGSGLSLREAVALATAAGGSKTISFAAGLSGQTIALGSSLTLPTNTTLDADAAGTLTLGGGTPNALTISGTTTLTNGAGDLFTLGPLNVSGTGTFIKSGAGTMTFGFDSNTNAGAFGGTYQIDGGTLKLNTSDKLSSTASLVVNAGGTFDLNDKNQQFASINGTGIITSSASSAWPSLTLNVASGQTQSFGGVISGSKVGFYKNGAGTLQLNGDSSNTLGGDFALYDGVLELNKSGGSFVMGTGVNARLIIGNDSGAADSAVVRWLADNQLPSGTKIDGLRSDGLLDLNGFNQTVGAVEIYGSGEIRTGTGLLTIAGGQYIRQNAVNSADINGHLALGAGTEYVYVTGGSLTIDASIAGTGNLNLAAGTNTLTLNGTATYTGTTAVNAGTLSIAGDSNIGTGALSLGGGTLKVTGSDVSIDNNVTLSNATSSTIDNANNLTLSGVLSAAGSLAKTGVGTLTLNNTNTYSGTLSVNQGAVQLDGSLAGAVTIANGGNLVGGGATTAAGAVTGNVTVQSGGTLSPGASGGSGVADLKTGNLLINNGGTLAMTLNGATTPGTDYDQIITTGTVNVTGATLSVSGSVTPAVGDVFVLVDNDLADAVTGTFNGLAEGATVTVNGTAMKISYVGGTGNDITLTAQLGFSSLAFSADSGTAGDFITNTASQTISATLSSALGALTIWGSLDNGGTWIDITTKVSGTTLTWDGVSLTASNTLKLEARNGATVVGSASQAYQYLTSVPTTIIATLAFSADSGTAGDFITKTAAQTISGTLSAVTVAGEKVQVSLDNGSTWADASNTVGQNTFSLAGQTLSASNTLKVRVADAAGNAGTVYSQAYVLDQTGPTNTFSGLTLSADTGVSATDFITKTAAQTVSATLSSAPAVTDKIWGSLDGGSNWADITSKVSGTTLTWDGVTLVGSSSIKLKVTDNAANDGTVASQVFVLDTVNPTASVTTANVGIGSNVTTAQSTETGVVYLVKTGTAVSDLASLETAVTGSNATKATVTASGTNTPIATTGLTAGTYKVYSVDAAGNVSAASGNTITLGTAPTTTVATAVFSADSGISSSDFITSTAAQDISGTLSAVTVAGETVEVSLDNGSTWTTATNVIGQSSWSLAGQTLVGNNTLQARVTSAGFSSTAYSHAYVLDTTAPTSSVTSVSIGVGANVSSARGTETGIIYLVKTGTVVSDLASLETAVTANTAAKATVSTANTNTTISTTSLAAGTYKVYSVDAAGNVSAASADTVTLTPNAIPTLGSIPGTSQEVTTGAVSALPDFTVADTDGGNLTVTLTATNGTIGGLVDADAGTAGIQLTGTAAQINTALADALFTATNAGAASIGFSLSDGIAVPVTATYNLNATTPSSGGGGVTTPPGTISGGTTTTTTNGDGGTTRTITGTLGTVPVVETVVTAPDGTVTHELVYTPSTGGTSSASVQLPLLYESSTGSGSNTTATLPSGIGLTSLGDRTPLGGSSAADLINLIQVTVEQNDPTKGGMLSGGQNFLDQIPANSTLWINKIVLTAPEGTAIPSTPVIINGASNTTSTEKLEALVIDASTLPSGTTIELQNVDFAVVKGDGIIVRGGNGANIVYGTEGTQDIFLGAEDDILYGGAGNDRVGSAGGNDRIFGNSGNDTVFGGEGNDLLHGGSDTDVAIYTGSISHYQITRDHGKTIVTSLDRANDSDTLINCETISFDDASYTVQNDASLVEIATLYKQVLGRQAEIDGFQYWAETYDAGHSIGEIAMNFLYSAEYTNQQGQNFGSLAQSSQISLLYNYFLGREAESAGLAYWTDALQNGMGINQIAESFVNSTEMKGLYLQKEGWEFIV